MQIMAVAIIPVAVSVHTIVSFDFSMAPVPMWQTTIFGPYFVAGAIFSGIAALLIAMAVLRKVLHLEAYLHPVHFQNLGKLLLVMALLWGYFVFNERLVTYYGNEPAEMAVFWRTQRESFAPLYWTMVICNFVLPLILMGIRRFRTITGCVIASLGVVVGHVARAVPDHRARARAQVPAVQLRHLPPAAGRDHHHRGDVRRDDPAVCALLEGRADHLDVGAEGRRSPAARPDSAGDSTSISLGEQRLMKAVYGLYADGQSAQQAVNRLRAAGLADRQITILSAQPMEDFEFGHIDKHSWMWWIACGGGLLGMAPAFGLTWLTEMSWPINVGGLPIFAWWPNLIIIFELTMLGAILATVIALVDHCRPGRGGGGLYDPEVTDGSILVGVENPAADRDGRSAEGARERAWRARQDALKSEPSRENQIPAVLRISAIVLLSRARSGYTLNVFPFHFRRSVLTSNTFESRCRWPSAVTCAPRGIKPSLSPAASTRFPADRTRFHTFPSAALIFIVACGPDRLTGVSRAPVMLNSSVP